MLEVDLNFKLFYFWQIFFKPWYNRTLILLLDKIKNVVDPKLLAKRFIELKI